MNAEEFGTLLGVYENFESLSEAHKAARVSELCQDTKFASICRRVLASAHAQMVEDGLGDTLPANHLKRASQVQDPSAFGHQMDLYRIVTRTCLETDREKQATTIPNTIAALGKGGIYAAGLGGAGIGALYWLLSRHARQGDAKLESLEQQTQTYNDLSRRIEQSLQDRYGDLYAQNQPQAVG